VYSKTNVLGLQTFLQNKFTTWASNYSSTEEIWNNFKERVFESIKHSVTHKRLSKNSNPQYYIVKRGGYHLKLKLKQAYNKRKSGEHYQDELK
jgi:hypothetical protein